MERVDRLLSHHLATPHAPVYTWKYNHLELKGLLLRLCPPMPMCLPLSLTTGASYPCACPWTCP